MNTKIKPQKIGTIITVLLFGAICAIGGYEIRSSTDSNSSVLPVAKGGTGNNYGKAVSADKLYTARNLQGYSFDGSKDISLPGIYKEEVTEWYNETDKTLYVRFTGIRKVASSKLSFSFSRDGAFDAFVDFGTKQLSGFSHFNLYIKSNGTIPSAPIYSWQTKDNYLYIKVLSNLNNSRPFIWRSSNPYVSVDFITDSDEIESLGPWLQFNIITSNDPVEVPTP
ncbi:MAG: hypothetical protein LBB10_01300 [Bifidobacteriaceae bacterium]|jgi:hypothetical protein|nr:hypothetical protein [Bifidobacteriaceae bacterium]